MIGGAAGAFPPMIGWAAVTGSLSLEPVVLFLIIFFWTPPHFWALALYKSDDYERAGIPMLPVVAGEVNARRQILRYTMVLAPLAVSPWILGFAGPLYGLTALVSGALMMVLAWRCSASAGPTTAPASNCSRSRSSICSFYSPCCWSNAVGAGCWPGWRRELRIRHE